MLSKVRIGIPLIGVILVMLLSACGGGQTRVSSSHSSAVVLSELRHTLARGARARVPLGGVVGASKTMVRSMLGAPYICGGGPGLRRAPECVGDGDWIYRAQRGGSASASVLFRFDSLGQVTGAEWRRCRI